MFALIATSIGGGIVYGTASNAISVGADTVTGSAETSSVALFVFVIGIILIAAGVMSALFIFASLPERKS